RMALCVGALDDEIPPLFVPEFAETPEHGLIKHFVFVCDKTDSPDLFDCWACAPSDKMASPAAPSTMKRRRLIRRPRMSGKLLQDDSRSQCLRTECCTAVVCG